MTAPQATTSAPKKRGTTKIRENVPAPGTPEGSYFHYTPEEAALWLPFTARKLRLMAFAREIPHVNNGNKVWFSGLNVRAITEQFTRQPFTKPAPARAAA
ncbi:hypothetical protein ACJ6WF_17270 [Streptomyces sp. MMS24-I2-30]|uniref:hypothetical protein n=1 Tax=Streptomyces sp. MMS24-I2-30 TaxID=3351564 RepID=UPI003896CBFE